MMTPHYEHSGGTNITLNRTIYVVGIPNRCRKLCPRIPKTPFIDILGVRRRPAVMPLAVTCQLQCHGRSSATWSLETNGATDDAPGGTMLSFSGPLRALGYRVQPPRSGRRARRREVVSYGVAKFLLGGKRFTGWRNFYGVAVQNGPTLWNVAPDRLFYGATIVLRESHCFTDKLPH